MATVPKLTPAQVERRRVDDYIQTKLLERRAAEAAKVPPTQKADYPMSVMMLGRGFMNLFDSLRGQQQRFTEDKK